MAPTQKIRPTLHSRPKQLFLCPITNYPCEGDLPIYAKNTAALAKEAYRHAPMKNHKPKLL